MKESKGQIGPFFVCSNKHCLFFATFSYSCDMVAIVCSVNATREVGQVKEIMKE
ncbi:hypothetical protein BALU111458_10410 [Bacillus luti]